MNPLDFMNVALRLSVGDEASRRSAVSRAYYCAYHMARRLIVECGVCLGGNAVTHEHLPWCLQNSGDAAAAILGRDLKTLRGTRNLADYELNRSGFDPANIARQMRLAQEVIDRLAGLSAATIAPGVRHYASTVLQLSLVDV